MEPTVEELAGHFFGSKNSSIAFLLIVIVGYLLFRLIKYIFEHQTDLKKFVDHLYHRRRNREELLEKIEIGYEKAQESLKEIQTMKNNYAGYREQSLEIQRQITSSLNSLDEKTKNVTVASEQLNAVILGVRNALIEILNDRLTQKCNFYTHSKGIPEDEIEDFQRMFDVYKAIGGNHGLEVRFNKTKNELPIIPYKTED